MLYFLDAFKEIFFVAAYVASRGSFPEPLSSKEEKEALEAVKNGSEEAKEKLIHHNLRLVAHIAKKYVGTGFDQDDIISIGTIGLIKAVSTFDSTKGAQLATYSARCIQNEILMALRSAKKHRGEVSLADPIGTDKEGNEITLIDVMGSLPGAVAEEVELKMQKAKLKELISECLTKREQVVIELRYGLGERERLPQREVAQILDISRSYVSRIEKKALEKLFKHFEKY